MKYILLISTLMFSAGSWAEWTMVAFAKGNMLYVDFDRIKKVKGLVYYWRIEDYLEPFKESLSTKVYSKADCETMREMVLSHSEYRLPMAEGDAMVTFTPPAEWGYVPPDSIGENTVQAVCAH